MESKITKEEEQKDEHKSESIDIKNTWVWVEGYKGTDRDMKCQGFQYEIGKTYQMPREEVDECRRGFHLCLNMHDVSAETIDEAPLAYKPMDEIVANIEDTVDILEILKPVYNFKASEV